MVRFVNFTLNYRSTTLQCVEMYEQCALANNVNCVELACRDKDKLLVVSSMQEIKYASEDSFFFEHLPWAT